MSMDMEELLDALKNADPTQLAMLVKEMSKTSKYKAKKHINSNNGPVKSYTTVIKNVTCLCCGTIMTYKHDLLKGEQTSCLDSNGVYHIVTSTGKEGEVIVPSTTSKCKYCTTVMRDWSREELERRFIKLLNSCTFKEVACYSSPDIYDKCKNEPVKVYTTEGKL
jgi:hypothetical protein